MMSLSHEQLWGTLVASSSHQESTRDRATAQQHPAARTTLSCSQVFLMETLFSEILSREIPNFITASQILFTISFHLDRHNNIVNSRALSTQGMQCLPVSAVYLCYPSKQGLLLTPTLSFPTIPLKTTKTNKQSKPVLSAREDQSRSTKALKFL